MSEPAPWSAELALRMHLAGSSYQAIEQHFGLKRGKARERLDAAIVSSWGLPKPEKAVIPCMGCRRDFPSEDRKRNRFCFDCKGRTEWKSSVDEHGIAGRQR